MNLNEKINYEFQCFYLDQLRTSKENIFAHSGEIEIKKVLMKELMRIAELLDEQEKEIVSLQPNLLESAYSFLQNSGVQNTGEIPAVIDQWKLFVTKRTPKIKR